MNARAITVHVKTAKRIVVILSLLDSPIIILSQSDYHHRTVWLFNVA